MQDIKNTNCLQKNLILQKNDNFFSFSFLKDVVHLNYSTTWTFSVPFQYELQKKKSVAQITATFWP